MFTLNCKGRLLDLSTPVVMGILNATPDSFYKASRQNSVDAALRLAEKMIREGAAILDIGGQSTRPGSTVIGIEEEMLRVIPVIDAISKTFPETIVSIDTYHAKVAREAVMAGTRIVNDISGGKFDEDMLRVTASLGTPYICMHLEGTPGNMHSHSITGDILLHLIDYFREKIRVCEAAGVTDIILDPGFGFSKTVEQNFALIKQLGLLQITGKPVLLGVSRKSSIYKTLGITPEESLNGTTVLNTAGLLNGASILRVHDVKEAVEAVRLCKYLH